jgi:TRAP-type C4-dicarboxylate transport system permease small subunit
MVGQPAESGLVKRHAMIDRAMGLVSAALAALGAVWTMALLALINLDVVLRWGFSAPLPAIPEFVALSITGIVFLQLANALRAGRFIKSDALSQMLIARYPSLDRLSGVAFNLMGAALFGCIAWATVPLLAKAWERGTFVGAVGDVTFPVWPINLLVIAGSALVAAEYFLHAVRSGRSL